jgi:hypothetical protein
MSNILKQVTLDKVSRNKDKSIRLVFITATEQTSEELMEMDKQCDGEGILYFKSSGSMTQQEIDELDNVDIELEGKSKSQRMRGVLFVYWTQLGKQGDFKEFYSSYMEKMIAQVKAKLDEA